MRKPPPAAETMTISQRDDETEGRATARVLLRPTVNSARTLRRVLQEQAPNLALMDLADELGDQCTKVVGGDLTRPEALLLTQGVALDVLFHDLTRLAYDYLAEHGDAAERLFRLAFRAQGQSRATLETLGALKNPPMVFAKQANVTTGPQQVNNGVARAHPQEIESGRSELLEQTHGKRLDTGTKSSAGGSDTSLETVGGLNGAANGGG
jgi:hypothetical protein